MRFDRQTDLPVSNASSQGTSSHTTSPAPMRQVQCSPVQSQGPGMARLIVMLLPCSHCPCHAAVLEYPPYV